MWFEMGRAQEGGVCGYFIVWALSKKEAEMMMVNFQIIEKKRETTNI
jgi:hypothetical protein